MQGTAPAPAASPSGWGFVPSNAQPSSDTSGWGFTSASPAPKVTPAPTSTASPAPKPSSSAFTAPLFGPKQPSQPSAEPFATPATTILGKGQPAINKAVSDYFTPPNPTPASLYDQAAGKQNTPGILQGAVQGAASAYVNTPAPAQTGSSPSDYYQAFKDAVSQGIDNVKSDYKAATAQGSTPFEQLTAGVKTPVDIVGGIFGGLTSFMQPLAKTHGLGYLVDSVNALFSAAGGGVKGAADSTLQQMVNKGTLTSKTANTVKPTMDEIATLIGQLALGEEGGKAFGETYKAIADKSKGVLKDIMMDPATKEHIKNQAASTRITAQAQPSPVAEATKLPIKVVKPADAFAKSKESGLTAAKLNTMKAVDMPPILRTELRAVIDEHGQAAAHTVLMEAYPKLGSRQAEAFVREAPTPQTIEEEKTAHQNALRTAVGEENLSPDKMTVIKMGPKAKPSIDTIDAVTGKVTKGKVVEPTGEGVYPNVNEKASGTDINARENAGGGVEGNNRGIRGAQENGQAGSETPAPAPAAAGRSSTIERPILENGQRVTKAANDINENLVKKGFEQLSPEEQSRYSTESYNEIKDRLDKAMTDNLDEVKKMATGEIPIPKDLYGHGLILFKTISALASKENDIGLLTKLADSPLDEKESLAGQTLGESGFVAKDGSVDVVKAIKQVKKSWDATLKAKGKSMKDETAKVEKTLKAAAKATRASRPTWEQFAKQLICNV